MRATQKPGQPVRSWSAHTQTLQDSCTQDLCWENGACPSPHLPWLQNDIFVQGLLAVGEAALQNVLILLCQLLLHISLSSPQNKWLCYLRGQEKYRAVVVVFLQAQGLVITWLNSRRHTYPVQPYDHFVVVVLVLVTRSSQREAQVRPGDPRDQEVHHGPELQERVVQWGVDQKQALLTTNTQKVTVKHHTAGRATAWDAGIPLGTGSSPAAPLLTQIPANGLRKQ